MRAHLVLSLTAAFARAAPGGGGGWDGMSHIHGSREAHSYSKAHPHEHSRHSWPSSSESSSPSIHPTATSWSNSSHAPGKHSKDWDSTPCTTTTTTTPPAPETKWTSTPCTTSSSTLTCPTTCHLDFHGTFLAYPTMVEYSSVYAQTINAYITDFSDGSPAQSSEETVTAPPAPSEPPLTWTAFGVVLTYPTTYVAYTSIDYASIIPLTAESTCASTSAPLVYPTIWPSLIAPSSSIQQPGSIPPATIIQWLDSLPTVQAQLGGGVCDPANGGLEPFVPTATVTSATTIQGNTRIVHTTTVEVTPTPTTTSTTPTVVVQTTNAAVVAGPGVPNWVGNALAAVLLAL